MFKKNLNAAKPHEQSKVLGRNISCKDKNSTWYQRNHIFIVPALGHGPMYFAKMVKERFRFISGTTSACVVFNKIEMNTAGL